MTRERDRIQENANKYIVKNCPARPIIWNDNWCNKEQQFCQNCTDCVIKQVINECKWETNIDINCRGDLAERIISEFDIEEVRE